MFRKHIVMTWCENTQEGKAYLEYNGVRRRKGNLWKVSKLERTLVNVEIIK